LPFISGDITGSRLAKFATSWAKEPVNRRRHMVENTNILFIV
jgi:hypothetical protein